jgi:hypothetical protein
LRAEVNGYGGYSSRLTAALDKIVEDKVAAAFNQYRA